MEDYTYIAADFDHDKDAVDHLYWLNNKGLIHFNDVHELQQSNDSSLSCSIKKSLKNRLDKSYRFILIVGAHTDNISNGGCQLCDSYNSNGKYCARGYYVDYRSFIKFECEEAVKAGLQIIVLYKSTSIDRSLCPETVHWEGKHKEIIYRGFDGKYHWDDDAIINVLEG